VIHLDEARTFLSIGDVSGRGVQAGAVMASLRSAVRAFVSEGHGPAPVLDRVAGLLSATTDMCFATLLCAVLDRRAQQLTVANAGHLPPLLISGGTSRFVDVPLGPPVGARPDPPPYREQVTQLPTLGCLVFYTDGLVERRGEVIDEGLTRLRLAADAAPQQVTELIAFLARELQESTPQDDTAMLGVHWM
jgi:serine phosphatase RsbU (regulator of sigma subunit)